MAVLPEHPTAVLLEYPAAVLLPAGEEGGNLFACPHPSIYLLQNSLLLPSPVLALAACPGTPGNPPTVTALQPSASPCPVFSLLYLGGGQ